MDNRFQNHSSADTPQPGESWKLRSESERLQIVSDCIRQYEGAEDFVVVRADPGGQVVLRIERSIPANERGTFLLDLEDMLKQTLDPGLHVWCEPTSDKSKLRKLRGVVIRA